MRPAARALLILPVECRERYAEALRLTTDLVQGH